MARDDYQRQLEALRENVLYMGELVADRLRMGLDAMEQQDEALGQKVIEGDAEVNELTNALSPITHGRSGDTTFLFGPSGAGKTCISRFAVERLREESFLKQPGVAETLDWARAVAALRAEGDPNRAGGSDDGGDDASDPSLTPAEIERTLGCLLKEAEDIGSVDTELLERLHEAAQGATTRVE